MMDLGGVSQPNVDTTVDVGKNNKVQAIALDFDLIIRAIDKQKKDEGIVAAILSSSVNTRNQGNDLSAKSIGNFSMSSMLPNMDTVRNMAKILNVKLGGEDNNDLEIRRKSKDEDDLSLLTNMSEPERNNDSDNTTKNVKDFNPATLDIRSKYAAKLRSKVEGGLAGVELANSKKEEAMKIGDAAGHLAARSIVASNTVSKSGNKWMASTGTGTLCTFLSNRSMKIALIPLPNKTNPDEINQTKENMELLAKQLPHVTFNVLGLDEGIMYNKAEDILRHVSNRMEVPALSTIVVSDREDYLGAARNLGMFTCRIRSLNAPRGNVSTSYTVEDIQSVKDVVNELNGISYNTVFNQ